ncbi:DNA replication complex subunit Gins51 [Methanosphaera sp.]
MDTFFQRLRDIQKKERTTGTLSEIEDTFYDDASNYLQSLLKIVDVNPLSLEAYQLRDAQRITVEICERREFKIITTALTNVQKSHDIFKGHKKDSQLFDEVPYNVTPEEEKFYKEIVDKLITHREGLMDDIVPGKQKRDTKIGFKPEPIKSEQEPEQIKLENNNVEAVPETHATTVKKPSKPTPPQLDENQIAMMFGQAPDDVFLDENNNAVKTKPKTDISTPFTPPTPPAEDTIALQEKSIYKQDAIESQENTEESPEQITTNEESVNIDETEQVSEEIESETYDFEELVEFKEEISTDILDEDEKTYGPFEVKDVVLLPESLVKILKHNDVINVIK